MSRLRRGVSPVSAALPGKGAIRRGKRGFSAVSVKRWPRCFQILGNTNAEQWPCLGKVTLYKGKPEIIVNSQSQISVL